MKLTKTVLQDWHETILKQMIDSNDWERPQKSLNAKFDYIYNLKDNGMIEESTDTSTGAAHAKVFKITDKGKAYYQFLVSLPDYDANYWDAYEIEFYMIAGDQKELFSILVDRLVFDPMGYLSTEHLLKACRNSDNGFFHILANLMDTKRDVNRHSFIFLDWFSSNLEEVWDGLDENGEEIKVEKRLNSRISYLAYIALQRIVKKLEDKGLKKHPASKVASDSLAMELALIVFASQLEDLL